MAQESGREELQRWERYDRRVLAALVRLPVCRPGQLAKFLGAAEAGVQGALLRLRERGWARDCPVSTPRDIVNVWLPTPGVWASYAEAGVDLKALVAVERHVRDLLLDSTEALAVAELVAQLVHGARERGMQVAQAMRLRPGAAGAVFAGSHGMVLLVGEEWCSPLFVLVDRQETTPAQRRELVRQWTALLAERPFMAGAMLLIVTPTHEEMDQWDFFASVSRSRRSVPSPPIYMATGSAISSPWMVEWERLEGKGRTYLYPSLHRLGQVPLDLPLPFRNAKTPVLPERTAGGHSRGLAREQPTVAGRRILVTLLRHPACVTQEVAALADLADEEAVKVLENLAQQGLVREVDGRWVVTSDGNRLGRRLLGVPLSRKLAFPQPRLLPHDLEVRAFLAQLAREVSMVGGKVVALREAPTTRREWQEGGKRMVLVPDVSVAFAINGRMTYALVEWDRGQMMAVRWQRKLYGYRSYYRHLWRHGQPLYLPFLLVVAPDLTREEAIAAAIREVLPPGVQSLVRTSNRLVLGSRGVLGAAWRQVSSGAREEFYRLVKC